MFHFFVTKDQVSEKTIRIVGGDVNHIKNVLRMKAGEKAVISDGENCTYECALSAVMKEEALFSILETHPFTHELPIRVTLFQGLPKADKLERIIEKTVELGVDAIVPVQMQRSIVKPDPKKEESRRKRYLAIAESAAKQAGRNVIPNVTSVLSFREAVRMASDLDVLIVPYECAEGMGHTREVLSSVLKHARVGIVIGPEGGFEAAEIDQLKEAGGRVITLGRRILRTETAGPYLMSVLSYLFEEST